MKGTLVVKLLSELTLFSQAFSEELHIIQLDNASAPTATDLDIPNNFRLFRFLCGNEAYTDSFFGKIVVKVFLRQHFTIP